VLAFAARAAVTASAVSSASAVVVPRTLLAFPRRSRLRALDELLWLNEPTVLVLGDELEADPAASLVDLGHLHVEDVAATDHVFDVGDPAGPHVRDVQKAVGALLQLDEGTEVGRLDDLAGVLVADRAPS
jgi:hypothetical protein